MKQYIDKDAIAAEIERRLEALANTSAGDDREFAAIIGAQHYELISLVQYINTLEVKEVEEEPVSNDLEREIKHYVYDPYFDLNGVAVKEATDYLTVEDVADIARHFAQWQKKQEAKEVDIEEEFDNYTKDILACDIQFEPFTHLHNCAKYFFELGLKAKRE